MIYMSPKGTLFSYSDGFAQIKENEIKAIKDEQLLKCVYVANLPFAFIPAIEKIGVENFLKEKEKGTADALLVDFLISL